MKNILLFGLAITACIVAHGQMQGKKILTTTLTTSSVNFSSQSNNFSGSAPAKASSFSIQLNPELTYGKVNSKNVLVAYGLALGYARNVSRPGIGLAQKNTNLSAGPVVLVQKFIPITEKIYFSPLGRAGGSYQWNYYNLAEGPDQSGWNAGVSIHPLSVTFNVRPKANLIMIVGAVGANYSSTKTDYATTPSTSRSRGGTVYAVVNSFAFGYQRLL